jgi:hypothetical protein
VNDYELVHAYEVTAHVFQRYTRSMRSRLNLAWIAVVLAGCTASHDVFEGGFSPDASVDDSDDGARAGKGGKGGSGGRAGASAGRGGSGGTGGRAGSTAMAGRGAAGSSSTGCNNCPEPGPLAGFIQATSCCTTSNTCGLTVAALGVADCLPLDAPGTADTNCPPVVIAQFITLDGCCSPDGTCGAQDTFLGLGCAQVAAQGQQVSCGPQ